MSANILQERTTIWDFDPLRVSPNSPTSIKCSSSLEPFPQKGWYTADIQTDIIYILLLIRKDIKDKL